MHRDIGRVGDTETWKSTFLLYEKINTFGLCLSNWISTDSLLLSTANFRVKNMSEKTAQAFCWEESSQRETVNIKGPTVNCIRVASVETKASQPPLLSCLCLQNMLSHWMDDIFFPLLHRLVTKGLTDKCKSCVVYGWVRTITYLIISYLIIKENTHMKTPDEIKVFLFSPGCNLLLFTNCLKCDWRHFGS